MAKGFAVAGSEWPFSNIIGWMSRRKCRRNTRGRLWWVSGIHVALCLFASAASAATFVLDNGESLEGEVIHATRNTFMVREAIGTIRQLSHGEVERVDITTRDGDVVSGVLLDWRDGVYAIESDGRQFKVDDGRIVDKVEPKVPVLAVSEAEAAEGASALEFRIALSQPAGTVIFLVYGTFDRTAKAGEDYRREQGSLEIQPGDESAVLRIPLMDDDVREEDETFELFVSADKKLATIENNRAVGTILNDDD